MPIREQSIGTMVLFLVPSLKLKQPGSEGRTPEAEIHRYLLDTFGGYTAAAGNIHGYWKDEDGSESYGEHKEYKVGLRDPARLPELKAFLARLSAQLDEECIYV